MTGMAVDIEESEQEPTMKAAVILIALAVTACQPRENFDPSIGMMMLGMGQMQTQQAQPAPPSYVRCNYISDRLGGWVQTCQ